MGSPIRIVTLPGTDIQRVHGKHGQRAFERHGTTGTPALNAMYAAPSLKASVLPANVRLPGR